MKTRYLFFLPLLLFASQFKAQDNSWNFKDKVELSMINQGCEIKWNDKIQEYILHCREWTTIGEYDIVRGNLPTTFPLKEADWVLANQSRNIIDALSKSDRESLFAWHLFSFRLTHIGSVEAIFKDKVKLQDLRCYAAAENALVNGKRRECMPVAIYKNDCEKVSEDFSELNPSKFYVQAIPGTEFTAILFYVLPIKGQPDNYAAWWRFVFMPVGQDCMEPLPLENNK